jgi:hypothetical protein
VRVVAAGVAIAGVYEAHQETSAQKHPHNVSHFRAAIAQVY